MIQGSKHVLARKLDAGNPLKTDKKQNYLNRERRVIKQETAEWEVTGEARLRTELSG